LVELSSDVLLLVISDDENKISTVVADDD